MSTATIIVPAVDFFARQRRDQAPGQRHAGIVIIFPADRARPHLDEVSIFRRALNLRAERAGHCAVYTTNDDGSAA